MLTQNHPAALDENGPFLKSHSSDEHTVGKNYIVSGTNIETLPESSKVKCSNSINVMNVRVQVFY